MVRVWVYKLGRFEVQTKSELGRAAVGTVLTTGLALLPNKRIAATVAGRLLKLDDRVHGLERVDRNATYVVTPLHEGFVDVVLLGRLPLDLTFVARAELFDWPLLGRLMKCTGQIRIDPESRVSGYRQMITDIRAATDRGRSVVMFPQGSILGIEAQFHRGPFHVADRLGLPVLPVVITGTHRVWEHPYSDRLRFGEAVEMTVLEPLPPGTAESSMSALQTEMKRTALEDHGAPARRFEPDRDGFWDGYAYEIDPAFRELSDRVALHRATV